MVVKNRTVLLLVVLNCILTSYLLGHCKVVLKRIENCDRNGNYHAKINLTLKMVGDEQYVDGNIVFAAALDNNLRHNVSFEMLVGNKFVYTFSINERKSCDAINKYFGEFWYDLERHAGMMPRLCPIVKGRYQLHNYLLDWEKMATLRNFPFGHQRVWFMIYDNKNTIYSCFILEAIKQL